GLRRALQQRPAEQRDGLHHAEGHAGGAAAGDPRGARPEVGGGPETTADSSPASRLTYGFSDRRGRCSMRALAGYSSLRREPPRKERLRMRPTLGFAGVVCLIVAGAAWSQRTEPPKSKSGESAIRVLDEFIVAWNARDAHRLAATCNFPHVRIAAG